MKLVSIIIPVYNISQYVDKCVQSACEQTYSNIEIILVDDGSTDDSGKKCDEWVKKDSRISVVHKQNGGLSDARNAGLNVAKGDYIYFLDGDDYVAPDLLEKTVKYLDDGCDLVSFCFYTVKDGKIESPITFTYSGRLFSFENNTDRIEFICKVLLKCRIGWEAWNRVYRRDIIEKYNLRFADNRVIFAEDMYFSICYCSHISRIVSLREPLYYYIKRDTSIMGQDSVKPNFGRMNELAKAVKKHLSCYNECKEIVDKFPVIHYSIMNHIVTYFNKGKNLSVKEIRQILLKDISDFSFYSKSLKKLKEHKDLLSEMYCDYILNENLIIQKYYIDGNYLSFALNCKCLNRFHHLDRYTVAVENEYYQFFDDNRVHYIFIGSEDFGNIGDHKIAEEINSFLNLLNTNNNIKEITASEYYDYKNLLKKYIKPTDVIILTGGGNFGDVYNIAQDIREDVILTWKENKKIVFPQTVFYSDTEDGKERLESSKKIFTRENNVYLFSREKYSYDLAKKYFECNSYLVPDIVLSCNEQKNVVRENNTILCLRSDIEETLSGDDRKNIISYVNKAGLQSIEIDFQKDYHISKQNRKNEIERELYLIRKTKLVITDRLHGMVFAAITGTPCIVLSNYNHKVKGTYEWIKYLPYIKYAENVSDVEKYIPELLAMDNCKYDNTPLKPYFDKLAEVVKSKC